MDVRLKIVKILALRQIEGEHRRMEKQAEELAHLLEDMVSSLTRFAEKLQEEIASEYGHEAAEKICKEFGLSYREITSLAAFVKHLANLSPAVWKRCLKQIAAATLKALGLEERSWRQSASPTPP